MERWVVINKKADFKGIGSRFGIDQVTARIIRNRDVVGDEAVEEFLHGGQESLHDPRRMKDAMHLVEVLRTKIAEKKHIRIIGDYDIDGVMSTYILLTALQECGANVSARIPDRVKDGYGLNRRLIEQAHEDGVDTILTCDNGIAAIDEIQYAVELGMTVLVTDHHEPPYAIEDGEKVYLRSAAEAVVNPHQQDCAYPYKDLCGAGVAFKIICLLFQSYHSLSEKAESQSVVSMPSFGMESQSVSADNLADTGSRNRAVEAMPVPAAGIPPKAAKFLQFVAFATVGDIMSLTGENRILVKEGLKQIHHTDHVGLRALIARCGLQPEQIDAYHFGFVLGPCINATGRLDTASRALELFCEQDQRKAEQIAEELVVLNEERKLLTEKGVEEAIRICEGIGEGITTDSVGAGVESVAISDKASGESVAESTKKTSVDSVGKADIESRHNYTADPVLVLYLPDVHESIAGIIAGRIRDRYYKPTFVLTRSEDGVKGSGRSVEEYSMYEEMCKCREVFSKFGGHPMAAGLSLPEENVEIFREKINELCPKESRALTAKIKIDVPMPLSYVTAPLVREFSMLAPFGKSNPKPVFADRNLKVCRMRKVGMNQNVLQLTLETEDGFTAAGICFRNISELEAYLVERFGQAAVDAAYAGRPNPIRIAAVYYPRINSWQGRESVQYEIQAIQ